MGRKVANMKSVDHEDRRRARPGQCGQRQIRAQAKRCVAATAAEDEGAATEALRRGYSPK